ncbi:MAG: sugar-binding transcriptional regulator [Alphaproteobacteria bacterium]|nr:MAG: sugar-binding transcriptional regulator [Alphaproteobacteria bacterium]
MRERAATDPHNQLRIRAAWLYYVEGMTQAEVAERLGVSRVMITRLISDARRRGEVVIRIKSSLAPLIELQHRLEERFGLERAILAPLAGPELDPTRAIAAVAGAYVPGIIEPDTTIGVGWGRTLHMMLPYVEGRPVAGLRVVSLLGGISQARRFNPAEFAWQFAELFNAEGYLIPAPALVDSPQTRHALLEHCGLDQILQMAETSNLALLSCGGIDSLTTSYRVGHVSEAERQSLIAAGAVGDILFNFLDRNGEAVDHPVNQRSISLSLDRLKRIRKKVLISGGRDKIDILRSVIRAVSPTVLVTDEQTAQVILELE